MKNKETGFVMGIETIADGNEIIAIIVHGNAPISGNNFFTKEGDPLQFGVNVYETGYESRPHVHVMPETMICNSQEMLHVDSGKLELSLFTKDGIYLCSRVLISGDSVFFASGGHGIKFMEPTKIIEVKQGPYLGVSKDKKFIKT